MILEFRRASLELNVKTVDVSDTSMEVKEIVTIVKRAYGLKRTHRRVQRVGINPWKS